MMQSLAVLGNDPTSVASITGFPWIVSINLNAKQYEDMKTTIPITTALTWISRLLGGPPGTAGISIAVSGHPRFDTPAGVHR